MGCCVSMWLQCVCGVSMCVWWQVFLLCVCVCLMSACACVYVSQVTPIAQEGKVGSERMLALYPRQKLT